MRKYILLTFLLTAVLSFAVSPDAVAAGRKAKDLHYTDTLHTPRKQVQLLKAIELAPDVFVYDEFVRVDEYTVTIKGMKFNASMKNTLDSDFIADDAGLAKRLKRLARLTRPLNGVCDLTVRTEKIPEGLAVDYKIRNISVFGIGRVSDVSDAQ